MVSLFAAIRHDEICRLRVGCVSWQRTEGDAGGAAARPMPDPVCFLSVPTNKTSTAFTKPTAVLPAHAGPATPTPARRAEPREG